MTRGLALALLLLAGLSQAQAVAQTPSKVWRIGFLGDGSPEARAAHTLEPVREGLRDFGYVEGRNLTLDARWSGESRDRSVGAQEPSANDIGSDGVRRGRVLMSYGPDLAALCRRAAVFVDKIFKGGRPGDIPVEQPTRFELVLNLKTAQALGITVPPTLRLRADRVLE